MKVSDFACFLFPMFIFLLSSNAPALASVTLDPMFSDNMVLQSGTENVIYGRSNANEMVTVEFAGQSVTVKADATGSWKAVLKNLTRNACGALTITGENKVVLSNVVVGEVWLCAGQSNMSLSVADSVDIRTKLSRQSTSDVRFLIAPPALADTPLARLADSAVAKRADGWRTSDSKDLGSLSAVAYEFATRLSETLHCPVGVVQATYCGSPIRTWISQGSFGSQKALSLHYALLKLKMAEKILAEAPALTARGAGQGNEKSTAAGTVPGTTDLRTSQSLASTAPASTATFEQAIWPSTVFNAMINPIRKTRFKGVLWYQGEADTDGTDDYAELFKLMINDWRKVWKQPDLPFVFVQLPNFSSDGVYTPKAQAWSNLRTAQSSALSLKNVAMVVSLDQGSSHNLHPANKQVVGDRLAQCVLEGLYGAEKSVTTLSPVLKTVEIRSRTLCCVFSNGQGLHIRGDMSHLKAYGSDGSEIPIQTSIQQNRLAITPSASEQSIARVEYANANDPTCCLYNELGLPAAPFVLKIPAQFNQERIGTNLP